MKLFYAIIILITFSNCSFDDKTGIWKDENSTQIDDDNPFSGFKNISDSKKFFDTEVNLDKKFIFNLSQVKENNQWKRRVGEKADRYRPRGQRRQHRFIGVAGGRSGALPLGSRIGGSRTDQRCSDKRGQTL